MSREKSGSGDVGIKAIAKKLGVSASTVSRALNEVSGIHPTTRKLVQETAKAMGYVPHLGAKQLVGKSSKMIGLFVPQFEFEASSGFIDMFAPLQQALKGYGRDAIFFSVPFIGYTDNRLAECINSRGLEGAIVFPAFSESHPIMKEALQLQVPCVNFENVVGPRCSSVISDDREGGRAAGRKLLAEGHRIIGYVNGPPWVRVCEERYAGFREALTEADIIHEANLVENGNFSGTSGSEAAIALWENNPRMTALFCANDLMAMGAMMAFSQRGIKVPESISVVGYDGDHFTAYTSPPLTTVRHPIREMSSRAAALVMELLEGGTGRRESVTPMLIERQTIARWL
ncbi:LacI family transcriptional regulator [Cohnella endophytica]|uniref:LacI family transcriptional regulator n=1 Tax=Cohnella endophytica TaxID=2419778 RepID=A0A494X5A7_9BACL|nr:LacI family DNA-binding transcriptional regulator [Cohnella endophytica]RKP45877.1 LacI family transcriptional regulator [Cohnella endophytica]